MKLHIHLHVVVENQLAEGVPDMRDALARLRAGGLDRHEAVHALASTFAGALAQSGHKLDDTLFAALRVLTVEGWQAQRATPGGSGEEQLALLSRDRVAARADEIAPGRQTSRTYARPPGSDELTRDLDMAIEAYVQVLHDTPGIPAPVQELRLKAAELLLDQLREAMRGADLQASLLAEISQKLNAWLLSSPENPKTFGEQVVRAKSPEERRAGLRTIARHLGAVQEEDVDALADYLGKVEKGEPIERPQLIVPPQSAAIPGLGEFCDAVGRGHERYLGQVALWVADVKGRTPADLVELNGRACDGRKTEIEILRMAIGKLPKR